VNEVKTARKTKKDRVPRTSEELERDLKKIDEKTEDIERRVNDLVTRRGW